MQQCRLEPRNVSLGRTRRGAVATRVAGGFVAARRNWLQMRSFGCYEFNPALKEL